MKDTAVRGVDWSRLVSTHAPLHVRYAEGELVHQAGSYAAGTYLIAEGLVSDRASVGGRGGAVEILGPGDLLGLEGFLDGSNDLHQTSARAVTETDLYFFEREHFLQVLEKEEGLLRYALVSLGRRLVGVKAWSASCAHAALAPQLGRLLLSFAGKVGGADGQPVLLPGGISARALAELLNSSKGQVLRASGVLPGVTLREDQFEISPEALRVWLAESATAPGQAP
jgi:CRP-like cAMP-binding protein